MKKNMCCLLLVGMSILFTWSTAQAEAWMDARKKMVEDLRSSRDALKDKTGEEVDIGAAESVCLDENDTISACRKALRRARKDLKSKESQDDVVVSINGGQFDNVKVRGKDPRLGK